MDDKTELAMLMKRISGSLEAIEKSANEITEVLQTMRERAETELKQRVAQLNAVTATQKYTAGRWTRRDGDGFGSVQPRPPQPAAEEPAPNGDSKAGHL